MVSSSRSLILRGPAQAPGAKLGRLAVPLLLDERPILGHIVESLKHRFQRKLVVASEFFGSAGIRNVDGLVDHRRSDPPTLGE